MTLLGGLGERVGRGVVTAAVRAVLQLAIVSAVIVPVVRSLISAHGDRRGADWWDRARGCDDRDVVGGAASSRRAGCTAGRVRGGAGAGRASTRGRTIRDAAFGSAGATPAMDQTRTVGLVTLPGAFVGVLSGSGDPAQAAAAQVLVLIGLLAAEGVRSC